MIRTVEEFMITSCETVHALTGLRQIQDLFFASRQRCFPVINDGTVVGVLTWQNFIRSHPNRIVADSMSDRFTFVEPGLPFWQAADMLAQDSLEALLVRKNEILSGLVTPEVIEMELGRHTDLLTGLYKADYFYYHALRIMASGRAMSIIFIDVNNFGLINKQCGHIKGDVILKELSAIFKKQIPPQAFLCRFGGDEFIILYPSSREEAAVFLRNLEHTVACHKFMYNIPVTISAGIVTAGIQNDPSLEHGKVLASLVNMASLASTAAKKDNSGTKFLDQLGSDESVG